MLNLSKGQSLDLKKEDWTNISKIRVGLSWDVSEGKTMDLDLFVFHKDSKTTAFYNARNAIKWVELSEDNLTGEWDGDDEFVNMNAKDTADGEYVIAVNIFNAESKGQKLADVNNAEATIYNSETNEVLAKYKMSEEGGENTAIVVWIITDKDDWYSFTAKGDYIKGDINQVVSSL